MLNIKIVFKDLYNFVYVELKVFVDLRFVNIKIIIVDFFFLWLGLLCVKYINR